MIATTRYAMEDTRSPLISMLMQASVCLTLATASLLAHGATVLLVLGVALSVSSAAAGCHLSARVLRNLSAVGTQRLLPSVAKFVAASVVMAGPAWIVATTVLLCSGGRLVRGLASSLPLWSVARSSWRYKSCGALQSLGGSREDWAVRDRKRAVAAELTHG